MANQSVLLWMKIQDYLVELASQKSIADLYFKSLAGLEELIPYDITSNLFVEMGSSCIYDLRDHQEKINIAYNNYYGAINPAIELVANSTRLIDWRDFRHTEFVTDFINPQGLRYSLSYYLPSYPITIAVQRSRRSSVFKDRDYEILRIITMHLNNIYYYLDKISKLEVKHWQASELAKGSKLLSKREAEVASLLCQRLTIVEIATKLLLSPRTIETYVENIKEKLGVKTRRELILKLVGKG